MKFETDPDRGIVITLETEGEQMILSEIFQLVDQLHQSRVVEFEASPELQALLTEVLEQGME
jgi:hypothetical protein